MYHPGNGMYTGQYHPPAGTGIGMQAVGGGLMPNYANQFQTGPVQQLQQVPAQAAQAQNPVHLPKRLPNPVIVANEAIGYVSMCNDMRWRSFSEEELKQKIRENRQKFIGKQFVVNFLEDEPKLNGRTVQVCGMDVVGGFHCELRSSSDETNASGAGTSGSSTANRFAPTSRVGPQSSHSGSSKVEGSDGEFYSGAGGDEANTNNKRGSHGSSAGASPTGKRGSNEQAGANGSSLTTTASLGTDTEPDMQALQELVKLNIANLVPVQSVLGAPGGKSPFGRLSTASSQHTPDSRSSKHLSFDRVQNKIQQAVLFFKGPPPPNAKDQTIFNREVFSQLNQRYRTDEMHRLDILEMVLKVKKFHFLQVQCKDLCIWEDEQRLLNLDKINIETNNKRLRIKNQEAARQKHRLKEQNLLYAQALLAVRPACVGTGVVSFGSFDYGLTRGAKFEDQLYTRFVKFVKYGMCEKCQMYYLERNGASRSPDGGPTYPNNRMNGGHGGHNHFGNGHQHGGSRFGPGGGYGGHK